MIYVLDFDRTIFDTDAFITLLEEHCLMERFPDPAIVAEASHYRNLGTFVFPDADRFLAEHGTETIVLSSGLGLSGLHANSEPFLREKIAYAGVTERVREVVVVPTEKTDALRQLQRTHADELVFVDDMQVHVAAAHELGIRAYCRASACADDAYCITTLDELDERISADV